MAVLKPRNRLVYFRVSEDEFQQFTRVCASEGARSLSELARCAVQRVISDASDSDGNNAVTIRLRKLDGLIEELEIRTRQLNALIEQHQQISSRQERQQSA
jgi:hypothetical protein